MHFPEPAAYCIACRFRREVCLCKDASQVESETRLVVILHGIEALKMSNTGHLAKVVLSDCTVKTHGAWGKEPADLSELAETEAPDGRPWRTLMLFPGLGARALTPEYLGELRAPALDGRLPRLRLIVPDGTWSQARRMVKRLPQLLALPRVILPLDDGAAARDALRPRSNPDPGRVSTCEAIAAAYGILGESAAAAALYQIYDAAALRIALMRGRLLLREHRDVLVM